MAGTRKQRIRRKSRQGINTTYAAGVVGLGAALPPPKKSKRPSPAGRLRDRLAQERKEEDGGWVPGRGAWGIA